MTTITLTGTRFGITPTTGEIVSSAAVSVSLFFDTDLVELSYTALENQSVLSLPMIEFSEDPKAFLLPDGADFTEYTSSLVQMDWLFAGLAQSTVALSYFSAERDFRYFFQLSGDKMDVSSVLDANALLATITTTTLPSGSYAPDANLMDVLGGANAIDGTFAMTEIDQYDSPAGNDFVTGGGGNDVYRDHSGFDTLNYENLSERVEVNINRGFVDKGALGRDKITGYEDFVGTEYDDIFRGDDLDDGNYLYGRAGHDTLRGEGGDDLLDGGAGNDRIFGGDGADRIFGREGVDTVYSEDGDDLIFGHEGNDRIKGNAGDDEISGGEDDDRLFGNRGADIIYGDDGDDRIYGGSGGDTLTGGTGNDLVRGDAGADQIDGGAGDDRLYGGTDNDVFIFRNDGLMGRDEIRDWVGGADRIDLSEFNFADFATVQAFANDQGSDLRIKLPDAPEAKQIIILDEYSFAQFNVNDVIL